MKRSVRHAITGVGVVLAVTLTGCGKAVEKATEKASKKAAEKAAEKAIESGSGGKADVDIKDDGVDIKTDEGTFSSGAKLPDNWPDDIPLPKDFKVTGGSSMNTGGESMVIAAGTTSKSVDDLKAHFEDALSGWNKTLDSSMSGEQDVSTLAYELDNRALMIGITDDGKTRELSLTYTVKSESEG